MRFITTAIEGVVHVELEPIRDDRGFFARAWCRDEFAEAGIQAEWVQANFAHNPVAGTLRGLHFQREPFAESKLVRCTRGRLQDVAVDLRPTSPTYGRWVDTVLDSHAGNMLLVPPGCATGYLTLEPDTDLFYQTTVRFERAAAAGVRFDDPLFGIIWRGPITLLSEQDRNWPWLEGT
jgi:dTDP-4-dehydrorhamnose 3,5-epimerase